MTKGTDRFKEVIKAYLDKRAAEDSLFAKKYANQKKSIDECVDYIISEVQKSGRHGFADDEIYGMAIHYYDEENIKVTKSIGCDVVVNHSVELTAEEKEKARQEAIEEYKQEEKRKLRSADFNKDKKAKEEAPKQKEKPATVQTECEGQLDLFNMLSDEA